MASPAPLRPLPLSAEKERKWRRARAFHIPARHRARGGSAPNPREISGGISSGAPQNGGEASRRFSRPRPAGPAGPPLPPCTGWGEIAMISREARAPGGAADRAGRVTRGEGGGSCARGGVRQRAALASFGADRGCAPGVEAALRGCRERARARG